MSDDFQSHELITATKLNRALRPGRCIGRARRITTSASANSATLIPVLELDDIPVVGAREYTVMTSGLWLDTGVANDVALATITHTLDGSTPVVGSAILPGGTAEAKLVDPNAPETRVIATSITPAADGLLSLLLCVSRVAGSGLIVIQGDGTAKLIEMRVYDSGEDPGDTGVDL